MAYFKHFGIPITYEVDQNQLKSVFYQLSKKYHPDFYLNESKEKQAEVLELATLTNKAYQTLQNKERLLTYLLKESQILVEGERDALPADFLMEMMEINEVIMELEFDFSAEKLAQITSETAAITLSIETEIEILMKDFSLKTTEQQKEVLQKVKSFYYKKKYLLRIKESISIFASP